jgi:large subunit ribosomal protein L1
MAKRSKRYKKAAEGCDRVKTLSLEEAMGNVKERATTKFDESVELSIKLGIDARQSDQLVRGSLSLPHGIGKSVRVIAFVEGDDAAAAEANGAVAVGGEDLANKILGGWMDFDVVVAHPAMMRYVGKLGRALGPKGLMPSPKAGTVTDKVADTVAEFAAGKIEFRNDKDGNLHMLVGKASFPLEHLVGNVDAALKHVQSLRPQAVKGVFLQRASICSSMGPGFRVAV